MATIHVQPGSLPETQQDSVQEATSAKHNGNSSNSRRKSKCPQPNMMEALISETDPVETHFATFGCEYVVDSGTNYHLVNSKNHMVSYAPFQQAREVRLGGKQTPRAPGGSGSARISITSDGRPDTVVLEEVLFVRDHDETSYGSLTSPTTISISK